MRRTTLGQKILRPALPAHVLQRGRGGAAQASLLTTVGAVVEQTSAGFALNFVVVEYNIFSTQQDRKLYDRSCQTDPLMCTWQFSNGVRQTGHSRGHCCLRERATYAARLPWRGRFLYTTNHAKQHLLVPPTESGRLDSHGGALLPERKRAKYAVRIP